MSDLVRRENSGGAATLWLNRPEKCNALTKDVFEALEEHVDAIARETRSIGLVIVRGAGAHFSAGYDMNEVLEYVKAHATTPAEREAVCNALLFKTNVLWVQLDALYHAYVDGHIPPGAFVPKTS